MNTNLIPLQISDVRSCPDCDRTAMKRKLEIQEFEFGTGEDQVILSATVPVWICSHCSYAYTDGDAEELRHEAVCHHLGVMSPSEIVEMRTRLGFSQKALAEITKLGEASIKRWESGSVIQNASANMLLKLFKDQVGRCVMQRIAAEAEARTIEPVFRTQFSASQRSDAKLFQLRRIV